MGGIERTQAMPFEGKEGGYMATARTDESTITVWSLTPEAANKALDEIIEGLEKPND